MMTNAQWSMQCAYLASEAAKWAGDILTLPEDREQPPKDWQVQNFLNAFRDRLDRIEQWSKESTPTKDTTNGVRPTVSIPPARRVLAAGASRKS